MNCKRCHRQMDLIRYVAEDGTGHSEHHYRCVKCWRHETVRQKRTKGGFVGKANL